MNEKLSRVLLLMGVMLTVMTVVALALFASGIPENNSNLTKEEVMAMDNNTTNNTTINSSNKNIKNLISPAEAQEIAEKFIKEPGAKAGIPKWDESGNKMVYIVPVVINGTNVGEITINALTGENMGGAGGVS
ncbi:PepSY domain-containing protein [uncultured Methanobacterium sp.]|uniref:PepSY domain-containing protein n=1 Tax=uncultured Methanobacterium sp. TaxID=176306 RepID=UPI002AA6AE58|nr:PepSY domain-containing protein [uncultured Methanobacterium sp.]